MYALIDCDIVTYRIGWACEKEADEAYVLGTVRNFIGDILLNLDGVDLFDYECFLSGDSSENFRHKYAVTEPYKGNRKSRKPKWYNEIREYLHDIFNADISSGEEADDTIVIRHTELGKDNAIICSLDKDFLQVEGWHYNFVKNDLFYVDEETAQLNFYCQFLEGDRIDNIVGVNGIGPKKARELLTGLSAEEMYKVCAEKLGSYDRAYENGILLYLRRKPNEIWREPK